MRSSHFLAVFAALSISSSIAVPISRRSVDTALVDIDLQLVQSRLADSAKDTFVLVSFLRFVQLFFYRATWLTAIHRFLSDRWTAGTYGEALLELNYPSLSVFSPNFAHAESPTPTPVVSLVNSWASKRPSWTKELAHVENGASGDPPALGVPWIVAGSREGGENKARLWEQAREQLEYILQTVPRTPDGAISHRPPTEKVQLW